ncbi:MAG TPA: S8 family serine peptidase [Frankiaceae bacterium]|nr:S8 family serine peptidase [Frankiaceae bacterium]
MRYARDHGVTLVAAVGNESTDLGHPMVDTTSPDYPQRGAARTRTVDDSCLSCLTMPTEADGVIVVSAVGPSRRLAYYSNYGVERTDVAAPGGDRREDFGTPYYNAPDKRVLAAYPRNVGVAAGTIDPATGNPTTPLVVKDTSGGVTAYWQYLQGTSMAAPHAAGVAALVVSRYGHRDPVFGGLTLAPATVGRILRRTATRTPCPSVNPFVYDDPALADYHPFCAGTRSFNGFYGHGVVNALRAVTGG